MAQMVEKLSFRHGSDEPFCLQTQFHPETPHQKHRELRRGTSEVKVEPRTLDLLSIFLHQPKTPIAETDLVTRLWGRDSRSGGNVEQQVYKLRSALNDHADRPRFIETLPKFGYKFLADVDAEQIPEIHDRDADQSLRILEQWNHEKFIHFLGSVIPGNASDEDGDLRILTTAFSSGVPDVLHDLLERGVRIRILLASATLVEARNQVRRDGHKPARALRILSEQWETLETMKERSSPGSLEVLETDVMPSGIVIHSRNGALTGMFLATESYVRGPMIEVGCQTKLWSILRTDWRELWNAALRNSKPSTLATD